MREQWPNVSDATMRRWVKRARERAEISGWGDDGSAAPAGNPEVLPGLGLQQENDQEGG
jgi:hypothetical protein